MANKIFPDDYTNEKTAPVDDDLLILSDSEDSDFIKKLKMSTVRNFISGSIQTLTSNDTVDSTVKIIEIDASITRVTATLPDKASVEGQTFYIKNTKIGIGRILRTGADVIGEKSKTEINLYWEGDYLELFAGSTRWEIKGARSKITGGMRNQSAWQNKHLASIIEVDIDNGASPSLGFEIGELVEESISTFQARIYAITDNADGTGALWLYDCGGNLTDGRTLTGQNSSATADVNESGAGSTKNKDTNFRHDFGENLSDGDISYRIFWSSDGTEANVYPILQYNDTADRGTQLQAVDNNSVILQTGASGFEYINTSGASAGITASDDYFIDWVIWKI